MLSICWLVASPSPRQKKPYKKLSPDCPSTVADKANL